MKALRRRWTAVLAVLLALPGAACSPTEDEARHKLDEVVDALAILVGDPLWMVETKRAPVGRMHSSFGKATTSQASGDASVFDAIVEGRHLHATLSGGSKGEVEGGVFLLDSPEAAQKFASASRDLYDGAAKARGVTSVFIDGAGPGGALPGWRVTFFRGADATRPQLAMQHLVRGRFVVAISVPAAAPVGDAEVDAVLAYVDRILTPGRAAGEAPTAPRVFANLPRTRIRVVDPEGRPVPRAYAARGYPMSMMEAASVRGGVAEFLVDERLNVVHVWGARDEAGAPLPLSPSRFVDVSLQRAETVIALRPGVEIRGSVRDAEGHPAPGLFVEAVPASSEYQILPEAMVHGEAHVAEDGTFRIRGLATMAYRLRVSRGGQSLPTEGTSCIGGAEGVRVSLLEDRPIRVRVVDLQGRPVSGAWVFLHPGASAVDSVSAVTGVDGAVDLERLVPEASYRLIVHPPPAREDLAELEIDDWSPAPGDLHLARGWTLRGRVLNAHGTPVRSCVYRRGEYMPVAWTAEDGNLAVQGLAWEAIEVVALDAEANGAMHLEDPSLPWVSAGPGGGTVTLRVASVDDRRLRVRILDPAGHPVPRAEVCVEPSGVHLGSFVEVIGGEGRFEAMSGPFDIDVRAARSETGEPLDLAPARRRDVSPEESVLEVRLEAGVGLAGFVRTHAGLPAAGVEVLAVRLEDHEAVGQMAERLKVAWGETDASGSFHLTGLARGPCVLLTHTPPSLAPADPMRVLAPSIDVTVVLPEGRRLAFVDWKGDPVAGAQVRIHRAQERGSRWSWAQLLQEAITDASGGFLHRPLERTRSWALTVEPPRHRDDVIGFHQKSWKPEDTTVHLAHGFVLRGVVKDLGGGPASDAFIEYRTAPDARPERGGMTGGDGRFEVRNIPYGSVEVRAVHPLRRRADVEGGWVRVAPEHPEVTLVQVK